MKKESTFLVAIVSLMKLLAANFQVSIFCRFTASRCYNIEPEIEPVDQFEKIMKSFCIAVP